MQQACLKGVVPLLRGLLGVLGGALALLGHFVAVRVICGAHSLLSSAGSTAHAGCTQIAAGFAVLSFLPAAQHARHGTLQSLSLSETLLS